MLSLSPSAYILVYITICHYIMYPACVTEYHAGCDVPICVRALFLTL